MKVWKALQISLCAGLLCVALGPNAKADDWDKKTIVTFGEPVEIPGQVLPAGTYIFKLLNSNSNRHIVQVWNEESTQILATIMAIPDYRFDVADEPIFELEERSGDSPMALHSWFYPGEHTGQQIVYPRWH